MVRLTIMNLFPWMSGALVRIHARQGWLISSVQAERGKGQLR